MRNDYYYTYLQFFNVFFFLVYTMGLVATTAIITFRNKRGLKINFLLAILILLTVICIGRFLEQVTCFLPLLHYMRVVEGVSILSIMALSMAFLAHTSHRFGSWIGVLYLIPLVFPLSTRGTKFFASSYNFYETQLSPEYIFYILMGVFVLVLIITYRSYYFYKHHISRHAEIMIAGSICLPMFIFLICVLAGFPISFYIYFTPISAWGIYIATIHYMPTHIMIKLLDGLENNLDEIIIVADDQGEIIYKNKSDDLAIPWLKLGPDINIDFQDELFAHPVVTLSREEAKVTVELIHPDNDCFRITITRLESSSRVLGYMLVIKDVTMIHQMLEEVKRINEAVDNKNKSLTSYKDITSKYEMEKIIQKLVEDINNELGEQMYHLMNSADQVYTHLLDETYDAYDEIDEVIKETKDTLQEVRRAVRAYRTLYGEDAQ